MKTLLLLTTILALYVVIATVDQEDNRGEYAQADAILADRKAKELERQRNDIARWTCGNTPYEWVGEQTVRCMPRRKGKPYNTQAVSR